MVFPGAGYLIMNTEAMRQLLQPLNMSERIMEYPHSRFVFPTLLSFMTTLIRSLVIDFQNITRPSRQQSGSWRVLPGYLP
jgi:hypothetical protein